MTWLKLVKRLQLPLIFRENTIFLNELTGYVELSDFHEIWPEHSLTIEERNCVGDSVYIIVISLVSAANSTVSANFSILKLYGFMKNVNTEKP